MRVLLSRYKLLRAPTQSNPFKRRIKMYTYTNTPVFQRSAGHLQTRRPHTPCTCREERAALVPPTGKTERGDHICRVKSAPLTTDRACHIIVRSVLLRAIRRQSCIQILRNAAVTKALYLNGTIHEPIHQSAVSPSTLRHAMLKVKRAPP